MNPKPLVENAGLFKTVIVMLFCHASVAFLCANVMFDLIIFGIPLYILKSFYILPSKLFYQLTTKLITAGHTLGQFDHLERLLLLF